MGLSLIFSTALSTPRLLSLHEHVSQVLTTMKRAHRTSYFGSHCTYPLLKPLVSLMVSSKLEKSSAVTASKATSRRTRAHSKKA
jgi:hypothetical protein